MSAPPWAAVRGMYRRLERSSLGRALLESSGRLNSWFGPGCVTPSSELSLLAEHQVAPKRQGQTEDDRPQPGNEGLGHDQAESNLVVDARPRRNPPPGRAGSGHPLSLERSPANRPWRAARPARVRPSGYPRPPISPSGHGSLAARSAQATRAHRPGWTPGRSTSRQPVLHTSPGQATAGRAQAARGRVCRDA